jgi:hypothetical protein
VLSFIGRFLFRSQIGDFHSGLRGFDRDAMLGLHLQTTGMELASEMVVKSTLGGLRVSEVPTTLRKDGRSRPPHLRSWRDGWRHLRFLLIFSPRWLFLIPGLVGLVVGGLGAIILALGPINFGGLGLDISSQAYLSALAIVGYQALLFAVLTKIYAQHEGFNIPRSRNFERLERRISLESLALVGVLLFLVGLAIAIVQLCLWAAAGFGALDPSATIRIAVPAAMFMILGAQSVMGGMFLGVLSVGLRRRR